MSIKWTGTESGILRKSEFKEKKEELFVFGYSCKLFRDDDRALLIDQGKHLIPWMGDETLKIDRYDARGALHDLSALEAPPGGFDWRVELTKGELDVEQRCDEERFRALHTDEDEEEMYKEEELKRLHAAGYGQVGFNYDMPSKPEPAAQPAEVDEPFVPTPSFKAMLPHDVVLPESEKQNVIIEKTATFIAMQGAQMEILIKAKQGDNPQFKFLNRESELHPYYMAFIALVKAGKWPEKAAEVVEERPLENEDYLHPSLASTIIESAPSIPSIHYKPSADCDYTMLISKMRGEATLDESYTPELAPGEVAPPGTEPLPPRVTAEISRAPVMYNRDGNHVELAAQPLAAQTAHYQQYAAYYHQYMAQTAALQATQAQQAHQAQPAKQEPPKQDPVKSTGLSLMKNYNTDSDSDVSDFDDSSSTDSKDKPVIVKPPEDVQIVIDKMAAYVARNGDEFAEIVRAKRDPRFTFLDPSDVYHAYYTQLMHEKRGVNGKEKQKKNAAAPVSFSIKKLKEPDPILPKPALPYESSSEEESENKQTEKQTDKQTDKQADIPEEKDQPRTILPQAYSTTSIQQVYPSANIPPVVVYKMEGPKEMILPAAKAIETVNVESKPTPVASNVVQEIMEPKEEMVPEKIAPNEVVQPETVVLRVEEGFKSASPEKKIDKSRDLEKIRERDIERSREREIEKIRDRDIEKFKERDIDRARDRDKDVEKTREQDKRDRDTERYRDREKDSPRRDKRKHRDRKREHSSKYDSRESRRSVDREQKKDRDGDRLKKKSKYSKDDLESEIISLEDNSDDMIDLTGDLSDSKGECDGEADRIKQQERRRRAAEFLKKVGVDPAAAALPTNSLASAMVDTLESLRKKKAEEEEKQRKREKRRHRERHGYNNSTDKSHRKSKRRKYRSSDDNEESDYDGSKKKKRKKDKKSSRSKKKRRRETEVEEEEMDHPLPPDMDLTTTLKELRTSSPSKELGLQDVECSQPSFRREYSSDEEEVKKVVKRKRDYREYSEGEWSSDSEGDSRDSSRNGD